MQSLQDEFDATGTIRLGLLGVMRLLDQMTPAEIRQVEIRIAIIKQHAASPWASIHDAMSDLYEHVPKEKKS